LISVAEKVGEQLNLLLCVSCENFLVLITKGDNIVHDTDVWLLEKAKEITRSTAFLCILWIVCFIMNERENDGKLWA